MGGDLTSGGSKVGLSYVWRWVGGVKGSYYSYTYSKIREKNMSVQFKPEVVGPVISYSVSLWCAEKVADFDGNLKKVEAFLIKHNSKCAQCKAHDGGFYLPRYEWREVSVSNTNAMDILRVLGYESSTQDGIYGAEDAEAFLLKTAKAIESDLDKATRATVVSERVVSFGTDAGYLKRKLSDLAGIAAWANLHNTKVVWG